MKLPRHDAKRVARNRDSAGASRFMPWPEAALVAVSSAFLGTYKRLGAAVAFAVSPRVGIGVFPSESNIERHSTQRKRQYTAGSFYLLILLETSWMGKAESSHLSAVHAYVLLVLPSWRDGGHRKFPEVGLQRAGQGSTLCPHGQCLGGKVSGDCQKTKRYKKHGS